jgi:hypothetical protein
LFAKSPGRLTLPVKPPHQFNPRLPAQALPLDLVCLRCAFAPLVLAMGQLRK